MNDRRLNIDYASIGTGLVENTGKYEFHNLYNRFGIANGLAREVTLVVTQECQLRCTYCYECHKNSQHDMTEETAEKIADSLFEMDAKGEGGFDVDNADAIVFNFIGGEPLLKVDLIDHFMTYFLNKAMKLKHRWALKNMMSISSNGIAYFEPKVQKFIQKYQGHLSLSISIDGNKELHDACRIFKNGAPSWDIVERAFKDALDKNLTYSTKITISPDNVRYLFDAISNMLSYDRLLSAPANCVYEHIWTEEEGTILYNQLKQLADWMIERKLYRTKDVGFFSSYIGCDPELDIPDNDKNYCGGTSKMTSFDDEGNIYPCLRYIPFNLQNADKRKPIVLGNIFKEGYLGTQEEKDLFDELESITLTSQSTDECINCPISRGCGWCSGWNYDKLGTPNKRWTGICNAHKARVLANVYYWNKVYLQEKVPEAIFYLNLPKEECLKFIDEDEYNMLVDLEKQVEEADYHGRIKS